MSNIAAESNQKNTPAVSGENEAGGSGLFGISFVTAPGNANHQRAGAIVDTLRQPGPTLAASQIAAGVVGSGQNTPGVYGESNSKAGVQGHSSNDTGVAGDSINQTGVSGTSQNGIGVYGESKSGQQAAIYGKGALAGYFDGNVQVTGDISFPNGDVAEDFSVETLDNEPGSVMILNERGLLVPCAHSYDKKVAGVIAGAGTFRPGLILDKHHTHPHARLPVALLGKVFCKADASQASIEIGDLLTTSDTIGHAMKAVDTNKSFGTIIGKALGSLDRGMGLIPVLVSLQ